MLRRFICITLCLIVQDKVKGQTSWVEPIEIEVPDRMRKITSDSISSVMAIDFTGNGQLDFLMTTLIHKIGYNEEWLWWVRDDFTVYWKLPTGFADTEVYKFINLDDDAALETFTAWGYEDGVDYSVEDRDYETNGAIKDSFHFNPIISNNETHYWGYAGLWKNTYFDEKNKKMKVVLDQDLPHDGVRTIPEDYKMPLLFFDGGKYNWQGEMEVPGKMEWLTLEQIFKALKR